jgi:hypothetical protein
VVGLIGVAAAVQLSLGAGAAFGARGTIAFGGLLYRGDRQGRIFVSRDNGSTWEVHTALGSGYAVKRLAVDRLGRLRATIGFRARSFGLVLAPDQKRWHTS